MLTVFFILLLLFLIEVTIINTPLVLIFLLCLLVIRKDRLPFIIGFVLALFLDVLLVRQIGTTGLFFITVLFLLMLYQRKFEIATYYFVTIAAFIVTLFYALLFQIGNPLFHATVSAILAILFFAILKRVFANKEKELGEV